MRWLLWLCALWCGAAVMALELLGARLLMPVFGSSIEPWAAVIAATLGALSLGYWVGGRLADRLPGARTLALALFSAAALLLAVRLTGRGTVARFQGLNPGAGALAAACAVLVAPLLALGAVQPLLARLLIRQTQNSGKVVGGLLAVSTIGGVAATLVTGLWLIPFAGVSATLSGVAAVTALLAAITGLFARRTAVGGGAFVLWFGSVMTLAWPGAPIAHEGPLRLVECAQGLYGDVEVLEHRGVLSLCCNGVFQTILPRTQLGVSAGLLVSGRDYAGLIPYFRPAMRTVLVIGLGAGLHARCLSAGGLDVTCVEIEPAVVRLAARHFGLSSPVAVADGRWFLARHQHLYDAIILDAFLGGSLPDHLFTREAFALMRARLTPNGLLAVHLVGTPEHAAVRAVARTLREVFPRLACARSGVGRGVDQLYLFAGIAPLTLSGQGELLCFGFTGTEFCDIPTEDAAVLTDDRTCLTWLSRDVAAAMLRHSLRERRNPSW